MARSKGKAAMRRVARRRRRGATAVLAMLYLLLFTTLAASMYTMSSLNVQTADNLADAGRARSAAESGLRWMAWRFTKMARPKTAIGNISATAAQGLWPAIRSAIVSDLATMMTSSERTTTWDGTTLTSSAISVGEDDGTFVISVRQHPISGSTLDQRYLRVTSTGRFGAASRSVTMDFKIDKKVKYAIVGKVPIQIGRNTLVEGPIAMATPNKYPPLLQLSDFRHLTTALGAKIDGFNDFLEAHHKGFDNRISVHDPDEFVKATAAGYTDHNGDSYIDEYDLFVREFDRNGDKAIDRAEFTNAATGKLYDEELFDAIDALGGPLLASDPLRAGYKDGVIDNRDAYTKIRGQVSIAATADAWSANLSGQGKTINDMIRGPVSTDDEGAMTPPIQFGVDPGSIFDLSPANFDTGGFKQRTGPENGTTVKTATVLTNAVLAASDANGGTANERTPYGSTSYQATYKRPVFRNMKFVNCRIPKGLNALFQDCTFEGVTFVEMTTNITNSSNQTTTSATDGMTWSKKMKSGSFSNTTVLTSSNSYGFERGNNIRFDNCTIKGPVTGDVPTAYTHFTNSWEFTGATVFDNQVDQTATIVAPQTNIEMGSFTNPGTTPSTLVGVVVAGNIDIRGTSIVDGSIIVTGDGAGSTTQGWFGPSDDQTNPTTPMPEGGYGRLNVRYNPNRALPDGINIAVDITPEIGTYSEGV